MDRVFKAVDDYGMTAHRQDTPCKARTRQTMRESR